MSESNFPGESLYPSESAFPGEPLPGIDVDELAAAVAEMKERLDLLAPPPTPRTAGPGAEQKPVAFMVMPFGPEDLQIVYEEFVKPTLESKCRVLCIRGDDIFGSNVVMDDVTTAIASADIVIADLTGKNANVFYEVGIAHALNRRVLLLAQTLDDVPFDLRHRRILLYDYTPKGCKTLEHKIAEHVEDILKEVATD